MGGGSVGGNRINTTKKKPANKMSTGNNINDDSISSDEGSISSLGYRAEQKEKEKKRKKEKKKVKTKEKKKKEDKSDDEKSFFASCCCCLRPLFAALVGPPKAESSSGSNDTTTAPVKNGNQDEKLETIKLLLLGLDNAGKTTVALHLTGKSVSDVVSTIGFSNYELLASRFYQQIKAADTLQKKKKQKELTEKQAKRRQEREANGGIWMGQEVEEDDDESGEDGDDEGDAGEKDEEEDDEGYPPPDPENYRIVLYDLGGGPRIRSIWRNYYALVHGVIFVVDSTDYGRVPEVRQLLDEVVRHEKVNRKPILVFLNKQDLPDAMDEIDICKFTTIQQLIDEYQCVVKIKPIIANVTPGSDSDASEMANNNNNSSSSSVATEAGIAAEIESGLRWMLDYIFAHWVSINIRVLADSEAQVAKEADSMKERIERSKAKQQFIEIETVVKKDEQMEVDVMEQSVMEEKALVGDGQVEMLEMEMKMKKTVLRDEFKKVVSEDFELSANAVVSEPGKLHPATTSASLSNSRSLSPIEEVASIVNEEEVGNEHNSVEVTEMIRIGNDTSEMKEPVKNNTETAAAAAETVLENESVASTSRQSIENRSAGNGHGNVNGGNPLPPMEIIVTQPGSSGSSTGSSTSYLLGGRNNKVYPS